MTFKQYLQRTTGLIRKIAASAVSICLVAGSIASVPATAYAATDFTSDTPFSDTNYGKGSDDRIYTHNGSYAGNLIINGVDVSYWQANGSNWTKAKAEGVDFAILRVSYTSLDRFKTNNDTHFSTHYSKLRKAGVDLIGVYAYSQAKSEDEAAAEARFAIRRLKALGIGPEDLELPVYMDYEFGGGRLLPTISKTRATNCAKAFCEVIRNAGYKPGIYASTNFYRYYVNTKSLGSDVDVWCAQYYYKNTLSPVYSKWQYSSTANIDGIISTTTGKTGGTDVDFWYVDQTKNAASNFRIYGNTYVKYTGKPVKPSLEVYYGNKRLEEGKDYTINGVNNIGDPEEAADAYAYIQGIGKYSGHAVVPFKIKSSYKAHIGLDNNACEDPDGLILSNKHIFEEITRYLVRFVDEDGKDIIDPAYYQSGTSADDVKVPAPEKEGFEFAGWLDEDGDIVRTITADITSPVTYKAVFEQIPETQEEPEDSEEPEDNTDDSIEESTDEATSEVADADEMTDADVVAADKTVSEPDGTSETEDVPEPDAAPENESDTDEEHAKAEESAVDTEENEELPEVVTELVDTGETYLDLDIGYNSNESYIRNVPAETTASELLNAIEIREGHDNYSIKVLTASRHTRKKADAVKTGDVLCVYEGKTLVGTAAITVNGSTINDTGAVHLKKAAASKVTVAKTSIKKFKKYKRAFKVTVAQKSSAYVTGYQVRYSTKKSMAGAKVRTISTSSTRTSRKITGLKAKKKYYVQVRTYKKVNGKTYYSSWSEKKSVKTK